MKTNNLLLCALLLCCAAIQAQPTFTLTPNPVFGVDKDDYEVEAAATFKNLSANTETFQWKRTIIRLDNDSICQVPVTDPYLHWFYSVSSKNFNMEPGQAGPLNINLWDFEQSGCCAIVQMKVTRLTGTPDSVEAFYYLRECQTLAVSASENASIELFPNPASQFFSLKNAENVHRLTLCDATGKMLKRMNAQTDNQYNVADLPSGTYFLVLENKENSIIKVLEWAKL
jgi:hypothetical protein